MRSRVTGDESGLPSMLRGERRAAAAVAGPQAEKRLRRTRVVARFDQRQSAVTGADGLLS